VPTYNKVAGTHLQIRWPPYCLLTGGYLSVGFEKHGSRSTGADSRSTGAADSMLGRRPRRARQCAWARALELMIIGPVGRGLQRALSILAHAFELRIPTDTAVGIQYDTVGIRVYSGAHGNPSRGFFGKRCYVTDLSETCLTQTTRTKGKPFCADSSKKNKKAENNKKKGGGGPFCADSITSATSIGRETPRYQGTLEGVRDIQEMIRLLINLLLWVSSAPMQRDSTMSSPRGSGWYKVCCDNPPLLCFSSTMVYSLHDRLYI
jgi:hypothetical protein